MPRSNMPEVVDAAADVPAKVRKPRTTHVRQAQTHDFAKLDPSLFIFALFRPLKRGTRQQGMTVEGEWGGEHIKVKSADLLGADDLSVLLACLSLAGQQSRGQMLRPGEVESHRNAIAALKPGGDAEDNDHVIIDTTVHELLRVAGMSVGTSQYDQVSDILERLRGVFYIRETMEGNKRVRFSTANEQLLYYHLKDDGDIRITLCERLSRALLSSPYRSVYLPDYRKMKGDVARILLAGLSVRLRSGDTTKLTIDQMIPIVYGAMTSGDTKDPATQVRNRRRAIRQALEEIAPLDSWDIAVDRRGIAACTYLRTTTGRIVPPSNQQAMFV